MSTASTSTSPATGDAVRIRRAGADDAGALALAGAATFLETYAGILHGRDIVEHCRKQHAQEVYADWLDDAGAALWLAETAEGAAPVGYAVITPPKLPLHDLSGGDLELKRIYLLSRFHGGGVGRELMEQAVAEARVRGARRLLLGVYAGNARALAFYARNGFEHVGERRFQVGGNTYGDAILALDLRR
ncbi:GNAT family N-acetyltransferase [Lysobacter sp. ESA13C]|uniref:GNAT family N-acetyltransferase n=1 Tax=Lysobacter sp. ESA13C TaxID=2862676 RepID=UPI001CBE4D33|nr:GNAT family N-acetyltransferase [Lysobacter sp. ESA13C]